MERATFNASFVCSPSKARKDGQSPIELSLSVNGKRTYIQLPKKCKPEEFQKLMSSKTDNDIKTYCQTVQARINEIQTSLTVNGEPVTAQRIKDYFRFGGTVQSYTIEELFRDCIAIKLQDGCSPATIKKYQNATNNFYKYTGRKPTDEVRDIKNADILMFRAKAGTKYKPTTLNKELKYIKFFFTYAFNNGKITANPFANIKIKKAEEEQVFLTYDEILRIRNARITSDRLDKIRDTFLFMCFTGLEYADMEHLQKEDVKTNEKGQLYIKKNRIKKGNRDKGVEYISILYEDAVELWKLYEGELPLDSNQKFNKYLKELGTLCNISKNITTLTARHTYATYLLSVKLLPMDIVQKMLGHTNPTQTKGYAKMLDDTVFKANEEVLARPTVHKEFAADIEDLDWFKENIL